MESIVFDYIRKEYIDGLVYFSDGKISMEDANVIADVKLRSADFSDNSPLAHKGPRWLAKRTVMAMFS